jgi:hypothetical protein
LQRIWNGFDQRVPSLAIPGRLTTQTTRGGAGVDKYQIVALPNAWPGRALNVLDSLGAGTVAAGHNDLDCPDERVAMTETLY